MKQQNDNNTEQKILEAATKLFLERGFNGASTTDIARAANCNQALVHYYFRTKSKLFDSIFEKKLQTFISRFMEIGNEQIGFQAKLEKKIEAHFEMLEQNPRLPLLLVTELNTNPERLASIKKSMGSLPHAAILQLREELAEEIAAGRIRQITAADLLLSIVSLNISLFLVGPIFKMLTGASEEDHSAFVSRRKKENVQIILKSLRP